MKIKAGTRIEVRGFDFAMNDRWEPARIARTMAYMQPLPAGYHPVKFSDGGVLLVHENRFRVVDNRG